MTGLAKHLTLGQLSFSPCGAPRPDLVVDFLSRVDVIKSEIFCGTALHTGLPCEVLGSPSRHPFTLILALGFGVLVGHGFILSLSTHGAVPVYNL